jgi:hypothetical protein
MSILRIFMLHPPFAVLAIFSARFLSAGDRGKGSHPVSFPKSFVPPGMNAIQENDFRRIGRNPQAVEEFTDRGPGWDLQRAGISFPFFRKIFAQRSVQAQFNSHGGDAEPSGRGKSTFTIPGSSFLTAARGNSLGRSFCSVFLPGGPGNDFPRKINSIHISTDSMLPPGARYEAARYGEKSSFFHL